MYFPDKLISPGDKKEKKDNLELNKEIEASNYQDSGILLTQKLESKTKYSMNKLVRNSDNGLAEMSFLDNSVSNGVINKCTSVVKSKLFINQPNNSTKSSTKVKSDLSLVKTLRKGGFV